MLPAATLCIMSTVLPSLPQEVMKDMRQRFKIMNHQIEQLKDEITVMDHSLVRQNRLHGGGPLPFTWDEKKSPRAATRAVGVEQSLSRNHVDPSPMADSTNETTTSVACMAYSPFHEAGAISLPVSRSRNMRDILRG